MKNFHKLLIAIFFIVLGWSAVKPHDYLTWMLEVAPGVLGFIILAATYKRFKLTDMCYVFILAECLILFVGAKYTYAEMPLFNWIRDTFGLARNNYDKLGHFAQGFVPAMIAREIIIRLDVVKKQGWTEFFPVCIALSISAIYELIEWWAAVITGEAGESFLGTQGYIWDTQSDMLFALIGALCMVIFFRKQHDRQISKLNKGL